jgi:carbon monoxide dehydrogenase subunit G
MHLEGTQVLASPRERVWNFITDPEKIAHCLPDLQSLEVKDSTRFSATVKVGISFVRGNFTFDFTLLDQKPPSHSSFEAIGRGAGVSVRLNSSIDLKELSADSTELTSRTDAQLRGLLGEISPSLIQASTNKFTQQFFDCIKTKLETGSKA